MKLFAATIASLAVIASSAQAQETNAVPKSNSMLTREDVRMVAPALDKYKQDRLLGDVWKRPDLALRDRSIITLSALIARNQTIEMPFYVNLALDNGVKPREISEVITHLAFYSGWANAMSAVVAAKAVFAQRNIGLDQLPPASPALLPLDEAAEADRAARVGSSSARLFPGIVQIHHRRSVPRPVAASGPCAAGSQSGHRQRPDRLWPGRADAVPPQQGDGQRPDAGAGRGGHHAPGLLCRLAERLLGAAGRKRCL